METQIISLNVRGLGNALKRKHVFEWFKINSFDIMLIQEIHCTDDVINSWKMTWNDPCVFSGKSSQK